MSDILKDLWYIEISINDLNLFVWAIAQFKNAVCTILISDDSMYISPELDYSHHPWFDKCSFIVTKSWLIPWRTAK